MIRDRIIVDNLEWDILPGDPKFEGQAEQIAQGILKALPLTDRYLIVPLITNTCYQGQMLLDCIPYLKRICYDPGDENDAENELLRDTGLLPIRSNELYLVEAPDLIRAAVKDGGYGCVIVLYASETRLAEELYRSLLVYDHGEDSIQRHEGINQDSIGVPVIRLEIPLSARVEVNYREYRMAPICYPEGLRSAAMLLVCGVARAINPHIPLQRVTDSLREVNWQTIS